MSYVYGDELGSNFNWIGLDSIYGIYLTIVFGRSILNQYEKHNFRSVFVGYIYCFKLYISKCICRLHILFQIVHVGGCGKFLCI